MTHPDTHDTPDSAPQPDDRTDETRGGQQPQVVTIDRIVDACAASGIGLDADATGRVAQGEHEGLHIMVVLLDSVFITRADSATDVPSDAADPTLYLAANEVNSTLLGARAIVANRGETLTVRTEREVACAAGMTDEQLRSAASGAVNTVVSAHNAMSALAEQIQATQQQLADGS